MLGLMETFHRKLPISTKKGRDRFKRQGFGGGVLDDDWIFVPHQDCLVRNH